MSVTLKQLKAFRAVASLGQVRLAAEQLFLSQPATSMTIAELEKQLGCQLFDRLGNRLLLNHQGQQLMPLAAELLDRTEEIQRLFPERVPKHAPAQEQEPHQNLSGSLQVGASTSVGNYLLPELMTRFNRANPAVNIMMAIQNTATVIERLASFNLDIGCVEGPCQHPDIEVIPWQEDELVIICSPRHPLARTPVIKARELELEQWILREPGSGTRTLFDHHVSSQLSSINIVMELNQTEAIKQLLRAGSGISCLSQICVSEELERGELVSLPVSGVSLKRRLSILLHRKKYRSRLLEQFLAQLQQHSTEK